jgi:hypothetical protein
MFVQTPLLYVATHIQCSHRRSALRIHTDGCGPVQMASPDIGVCRVPVRSPGVLSGRIATGGGLLPFPLCGQADFIPQVRTQPATEGNCVGPGDILSRMIILLAILLAGLRLTLCQPLPPSLITVAILRLEKTAVLRPGDRIFADGKRLHGERPGIVFEGNFPARHLQPDKLGQTVAVQPYAGARIADVG